MPETWLQKARLEVLCARFKFGGMLSFSRDGRGGDMAVFWKKDVDFSIDTYSPNHIDATVNKGKEDEWKFTGFYREPEAVNHQVASATLRRLKAKYSIQGCCAGDFNEITRAHEKLGGRLRPERQMQEFRDVLDECGFKDLGYEGGKLTWCNGQREGYTIWERLERAVASTD